MCWGCPDFFAYCSEGDCARPGAEPGRRSTVFYLDSDLCEHLADEYGTTSASTAYHFKTDHEGPECECFRDNWWPEPPSEKLLALSKARAA